MILTQHERQKKLMQENFLDTLKIVPSGVIIINNKDDSIKFANKESLSLLMPLQVLVQSEGEENG